MWHGDLGRWVRAFFWGLLLFAGTLAPLPADEPDDDDAPAGPSKASPGLAQVLKDIEKALPELRKNAPATAPEIEAAWQLLRKQQAEPFTPAPSTETEVR